MIYTIGVLESRIGVLFVGSSGLWVVDIGHYNPRDVLLLMICTPA